MTEFFDNRIQLVLDETIQKSITPMIEKDITEKVNKITFDTIKNEINTHSQNLASNANFINKVATTVKNNISDNLTSTITNDVRKSLQKVVNEGDNK